MEGVDTMIMELLKDWWTEDITPIAEMHLELLCLAATHLSAACCELALAALSPSKSCREQGTGTWRQSHFFSSLP